MTADRPEQTVTVRARIRARTAADEPIPPDERWEQATGRYEDACERIARRVGEDELVAAWYVDR